MKPRAILKHHSTSYPFEERNLDLTSVVKVGRAVAKSKPQGDNAIFDCKVLSRNHALIWFEDGKFFLKDTRSSNGTFINNNRLGPANEDSPGKEIHSNDIIQFGVDVVDSTNKVTHGCIILRIKLFYPNGSESTRHATMFNIPTINMLPPYYSYTQMIEREQRIYQKLNEVEDILAESHPIADMLVDATIQEKQLSQEIDSLKTQCDERANQAERLQSNFDNLRDKHEEMILLHDEEFRRMRTDIKRKTIEIENLHRQMDRIIRQDDRLMKTSLVLLLIVLFVGGFDMIVMFTRLMV